MSDSIIPEPIDFDWDEFNVKKSRLKHGITTEEAEQTFSSKNIVVLDEHHSRNEQRYQLIGITNFGQVLFIAFTIRNHQVRIISARPASNKERILYAKQTKKITEV